MTYNAGSGAPPERTSEELWELIRALDGRIEVLLEEMQVSQEQVTLLLAQRRNLLAELAMVRRMRPRAPESPTSDCHKQRAT